MSETDLFSFDETDKTEVNSQNPTKIRKTLFGKEILPKPRDYKKAYNFALATITRQRRTEKQLIDKMKQHLYQEEDIQEIVTFFKSKKWIDDHSFAFDYIDSRKHKKGLFNLSQELLKKGISKSIIDEVSLEFKTEYYQEELKNNAEQLLLKKFPKLEEWKKDKETYYKKNKPKIVRFMLSRGFSKNLFWHLLNN